MTLKQANTGAEGCLNCFGVEERGLEALDHGPEDGGTRLLTLVRQRAPPHMTNRCGIPTLALAPAFVATAPPLWSTCNAHLMMRGRLDVLVRYLDRPLKPVV